VSLFCFVLAEAGGYEPDLLRYARSRGTGAYGCEEHMTLTDNKIDVGTASDPPAGVEANNIDENEIGFSMRMDERIIPLKPNETDGSHVTLTVQAEVYYKGNRHPTRRLLQFGGPNGDRRQEHSMSKTFNIARKQDLSKCTVAEDTHETYLSLNLEYSEASDMPSVSSTLDWASRFSMQLDGYLGSRNSVSVKKVEKCNAKKCQMMYYEGSEKKVRRRIEEEATHMKVELKIASTKMYSAGVAVNKLQDSIINKNSEIFMKVEVFNKAAVSDMKVAGCGEVGEAKDFFVEDIGSVKADIEEEESSAATLSLLLASFVGLWALW